MRSPAYEWEPWLGVGALASERVQRLRRFDKQVGHMGRHSDNGAAAGHFDLLLLKMLIIQNDS